MPTSVTLTTSVGELLRTIEDEANETTTETGATSAYQMGPFRNAPARLGQAEGPGLPGCERGSGGGPGAVSPSSVRYTINLPFDSFLVRFAQSMFLQEWLAYVFALIAGGGYFLSQYALARARSRAGLSAKSMTTYGLAALLLTLGVGIGSWFLYQSTGRGVGWMFVFFVVLAVALNYALTRTAWGRYVFAVGGNAEAARRAGINVKAVYTSVFVLCSTLAALGGILAASRLPASNQATGAG